MYRRHAIERVLSIFIITAMILSGLSLPWTGVTQDAYAKDKGKKNEAQKQACDAVVSSQAPKDYEGNLYKDELGDQSVFRGGNTHSALSASAILDDQINDFATPLPYGDTYIDTSKLNWDNPDNFIIDIKDKEHFVWISSNKEKDADGSTTVSGTTYNIIDVPRTDKNGNKSTSDPFGTDKKITYFNGGSETYIAYMGPLKSYLSDIKKSGKSFRKQ